MMTSPNDTVVSNDSIPTDEETVAAIEQATAALTSELGRDTELPQRTPVRLRPVATAANTSLSDQWKMKDRAERELRDRIRRQLLVLSRDHDRRMSDIGHDYQIRISDSVAKLESDRDVALMEELEEYRRKVRELEVLTGAAAS